MQPLHVRAGSQPGLQRQRDGGRCHPARLHEFWCNGRQQVQPQNGRLQVVLFLPGDKQFARRLTGLLQGEMAERALKHLRPGQGGFTTQSAGQELGESRKSFRTMRRPQSMAGPLRQQQHLPKGRHVRTKHAGPLKNAEDQLLVRHGVFCSLPQPWCGPVASHFLGPLAGCSARVCLTRSRSLTKNHARDRQPLLVAQDVSSCGLGGTFEGVERWSRASNSSIRSGSKTCSMRSALWSTRLGAISAWVIRKSSQRRWL